MANKIAKYVKESKDELKKVVWPSRKDTIKFTLLVIGISFATAVFLGALDFGFNIVVKQVIK
ncbi:preprotein translocase subunit SecE [Patescibacteria group bacterium]|nr:preprotein translocase subunit SecE [Patescibacteria group bacterium]MBU0964081.1 preprotein translocase subunit SecE [Patescibacteria group bacterium]